MKMQEWVRLPSAWIDEYGLRTFVWGDDGRGSDFMAALMALAAIAHHADAEDGIARLTYTALCTATGLSRSKLSNGLDILADKAIIERTPSGRSSYRLTDYHVPHWAKLPAKHLYSGGRIRAFHDLRLRHPNELNALKLYFLFATRRGNDTNMANISYDRIEAYVDIDRSDIKPAVSLLAALGLVYVEQRASLASEFGIANAYRLAGLDGYNHMGTRGRGMDPAEYA